MFYDVRVQCRHFYFPSNPNIQPGRSKAKPPTADFDWPVYDPEKQQIAVIG